MRCSVFVVLFCLSMTSCATRDAFIHTRVDPMSSVPESASYVVEEFSGRGGMQVSQSIERALKDKGKVVIDRGPATIREGIISNQGKFAKADIIISGSVLEYDAVIRSKSEPVPCVGLLSGQKMNGYRYGYLGQGKIAVFVRYTDVKSGKVLFSRNFTIRDEKTDSAVNCGGGLVGERLSKEVVLEKTLQTLQDRYIEATLPHKKLVHVKLFNLESEGFPEVETGHDLFEEDRLDEAKVHYERAVARLSELKSDKERAYVLYAYGVTLGYLGDKKGADYIDKAYGLFPEKAFKDEKKLMLYFVFDEKEEEIL